MRSDLLNRGARLLIPLVLARDYPARSSSEWATLEWRICHGWRPGWRRRSEVL